MAETAVVLQNLNVPSWVFLSFRRGGLHFFRDLVDRISWETLLAGEGADLQDNQFKARRLSQRVGRPKKW